MTTPDAAFQEAPAGRAVRGTPLSHVSIEVGHLYFEDFLAGPDSVRRAFAHVAPWVQAARAIFAADLPKRPRMSTCFLIDDYFGPSLAPSEVIPDLLAAARDSGLQIDYLAREAGCADAEGAPLARLVEERIVAEPPPRTTGARPPVTETGWLCNGQRSPAGTAAAMETAVAWAPPAQNSATRHSVFIDVELWSEGPHGRTWSCAFLAAVWQLLRLGLLRHEGRPVPPVRPCPAELPRRWEELPAVMRVNPDAAPFHAYRAISVLPRRFITTEQAVRTILEQVAVDSAVQRQVLERGLGEGLSLPPEPGGRIDYVFAG